jgi:hypothetical protein
MREPFLVFRMMVGVRTAPILNDAPVLADPGGGR